MKIICLVGCLPSATYFVNAIHKYHTVDLVIEEQKAERGAWEKCGRQALLTFKRYGLIETLNGVSDEVKHRFSHTYAESIHDHYFQDLWHDYDPEIDIWTVKNINADEVRTRLKQEKNVVILDHGTSLLKDSVISAADLALNLHWGLSPYYRGTHCTEWALINWDPYNIGVTIHKLTKDIDGGDVAAQRRAVVKASDTAYSINMQLSKMGTDLACRILKDINAGKELQYHSQEVGLGYLTLNRQWTRHQRKQVQYIERRKIIKRMLKYPARQTRLPIIEMDD